MNALTESEKAFWRATVAALKRFQNPRKDPMDAWFDRQIAHARACIRELERRHTPEEIAAAERALGVAG